MAKSKKLTALKVDKIKEPGYYRDADSRNLYLQVVPAEMAALFEAGFSASCRQSPAGRDGWV